MTSTDTPGGAGPPLVLGGAQIGQDYGIANHTGRPDTATVESILRTGAIHRVSHIDTARAYGHSEMDIAAASAVGKPPAVITKIAPLTDSDLARGIMGSWQRSVAALGAKANDVTDLLMHRARDAARPGAWRALRQLRESTGVTRIGVSVQTPAELLDVLQLPDIGHVQLPFNLLDRRWLAGHIVQALNDRPDVVVVARSVFLQGILLSDENWPAGFDGTTTLDAMDEVLNATRSASRAALCVRYALSQPWIDAVVIGAETPEQVAANVSLALQPPLEAGIVAHVVQRVPAGDPCLVDPSRWKR